MEVPGMQVRRVQVGRLGGDPGLARRENRGKAVGPRRLVITLIHFSHG